jgi:superfamily II DNA or RNA helicase/HKD family nuclease
VTELLHGVYDHVVTHGFARRLADIDDDLIKRRELDPGDSHEVLTRHIAALTRRALQSVGGEGTEHIERQVRLVNRIADVISTQVKDTIEHDDLLPEPHHVLTAIVKRPAAPATVTFPDLPETPLSTGALLTNGHGQPRIGSEVSREMASADDVDLLCAFIKWHGVRLIEDSIRSLIERGGRLRVITTTYMGATDQRALERLAALGADIRISYETRTTRLHAKAWLFRRATGTSTAYVGSSNLSKSALVDGLEWNVRLSQLEQPPILDTFEKTFDTYWSDPAFETYDPVRDATRLRSALDAESGRTAVDLPINITTLDVRPYGYQQEILERLAAEREVHGRHRNLVVMATGTGKTVVATLDYKRLRQGGAVQSLLFVAHQERILQQSRSVFRQVLDLSTFGELFVGGERPEQWEHVFASVQSLHHFDVTQLDPARFDMVIVDEFHHAEAPTYTRLLRHLEPRILLGLTATPERSDGQDIRHWFDGRTAVELRLWEALERQLLAPFQYFGIHDDVDLSMLRWKRGLGYDPAELGNLYTGHHARARLVFKATNATVDVSRMRALGFCVSIGHAEFMADTFAKAGVPAVALTSRIDRIAQRAAIEQLKQGNVKVLFTVDLFNEGIDLPTVDTILMLRPTESATIFLQQLGRGLRLADDKPCLTVLDFIGAQNAEFRFDLRYRALTGSSRRGLAREVEHDFPTLPAGCHIKLDSVAKSLVLKNLQAALTVRRPDLVEELRRLGDVSLTDFLAETGLELEDLYRSKSIGGWTGLRKSAGLAPDDPADDAAMTAAIGRMLHLDDVDRLDRLRRLSTDSPLTDRLTRVLQHALSERTAAFTANSERLAELRQVADILERRIERVTERIDPSGRVPLRVHARYSKNEACAAFGIPNPGQFREGVKWVEEENADILFVTLRKTDGYYSPTTMYRDWAETPTIFHWDSQSTTSSHSNTGQRYINHAKRGSTVHLFLRETKVPDRDLGVPPYLYAGKVTYLRHTGDRPMQVVWELARPLPADIFHSAQVAAG